MTAPHRDGAAPRARIARPLARRPGPRVALSAALLVAALAGGACSWVGLGDAVETSGFLGDYSQLSRGKDGQARLIYIDAGADFSGYEAILIDPVAIWDPDLSAPSKAPGRPLEDRARHFDEALRRELASDFELTDRPGPGTLHLRVALTDSEAPGIEVEVEILDSATGARLAAAVDRRDGPSGDSDAAARQRALDASVDRWAEVIRARLVAFRDYDRSQRRRDATPPS